MVPLEWHLQLCGTSGTNSQGSHLLQNEGGFLCGSSSVDKLCLPNVMAV